ncbi:MAG: archaetidylinositol phosphate synthase [Infirmifilum sp.]
MLNRLRGKLQGIIAKLAAPLIRLHINPNIITLSGLFFGFLSILSSKSYPLMLFFLLMMMFSDGLDGQVARALGKTSKFGAFFDSTIDRAEDALSFYLLYSLGLVQIEELLAIVMGAFLVSYTRARAESLGVEMAGVGIAERAERLILTTLILLVYPMSLQLARVIFLILLILTYVTIFQRIWHVYRKTGGFS